ISLDGAGNLFIAEQGSNRIRRVTADGIIGTIAGAGLSGFAGDGGPASAARLMSPSNVAADAAGNLYIADKGNNRTRKVSADGMITTVAGTGTPGFGTVGAPAVQSRLSSPSGIAIDTKGTLYIADTNNSTVETIGLDGVVRSIFRGTPLDRIDMKFPADV